jgi:hypothetical protein
LLSVDLKCREYSIAHEVGAESLADVTTRLLARLDNQA